MDVINKPPLLGSLKFLTGPLAGTTLPISKAVTTLGRDETSNDIVISDPSVSRHHARIVLNGPQWIIEKLAPQNTLTVNSRDVQQGPISDRDTIGLGTGTTFLFQAVAQPSSYAAPAAASRSAQQPQASYAPPQAAYAPPAQPAANWANMQATPYPPINAQAPSLPTPQMPGPFPTEPSDAGTQRAMPYPSSGPAGPSGGIPSIEVSSNVHADKHTYPLNKPVINIGREPSNDIVINELVVSGFHAQIVQEGNQFVLVHPHP